MRHREGLQRGVLYFHCSVYYLERGFSPSMPLQPGDGHWARFQGPGEGREQGAWVAGVLGLPAMSVLHPQDSTR